MVHEQKEKTQQKDLYNLMFFAFLSFYVFHGPVNHHAYARGVLYF
jgi:hypothetical protein